MSIKEEFEDLLSAADFQITDYLISGVEHDLNSFQEKKIDQGTTILKENTVDEIKTFGANLKIHGEKFKEYIEQLEKELEAEKYNENRKELKKRLKEYIKNLEELIQRTTYAIIPVKEMPWEDVIFRTVPLLQFDENKINLYDNGIAYYGEIHCQLTRPLIFGNIKEADPLVAPYMGELDIDPTKVIQSEERQQKASYNFSYVTEIIESFTKSKMKNQLARYHEGYQRHGDPASDYINNREDVMEALYKINCGIKSGRIDTEIAVCGIAIPLKEQSSTFVLFMNEGDDDTLFEECFEAFLRFSAACCEIPETKSMDTGSEVPQEGETQETPQTPGGQSLDVWSEEDLAEISQERGGNIPEGMEVWSEDELKELNKERKSGIPEGLEVWSEDELREMANKRQGAGLDIPEWESDEEMDQCSKCGYTLRKEWDECPICGTPTNLEVQESEKEEIKDLEEDEEEKEDVGELENSE